MTTTPPPQPPAAERPANPTKAIVYITAEGPPDAWVANANEIEVHVTQPESAVEAVIVVPITEARSWAADVYAAVTIAYREHTDDPSAMSDFELANLPDPGRVVFESLTERWHDDAPVPSLDDLLGSDPSSSPSSSLGQKP